MGDHIFKNWILRLSGSSAPASKAVKTASLYFGSTHDYVPRTQPAHEEIPLDWTGEQPSDRLTRAIFVASRREIVNEQLVDFLPERFTRC